MLICNVDNGKRHIRARAYWNNGNQQELKDVCENIGTPQLVIEGSRRQSLIKLIRTEKRQCRRNESGAPGEDGRAGPSLKSAITPASTHAVNVQCKSYNSVNEYNEGKTYKGIESNRDDKTAADLQWSIKCTKMN